MRILTISDIHGDNTWKNYEFDNYDQVVFLGDYFDDFTNTREQILENFKDVIFAKKKYPEKIKLLIGNHDVSYFLWQTSLFDEMRCSGFSNKMLYSYFNLYKENEDLFNVSFQIKNYLFSHAGLSQSAWDEYFKEKYEHYIDKEMSDKPLEDFINHLWKILDSALFHISYIRGGYSDHGSIFWADATETAKDPLIGFHQIVGHTPISTVNTRKLDETTSITYTDTRLGDKTTYELEI